MSNSLKLKLASEKLVPEYLEQIDWKDVWERPIEKGTAFEWFIFAAFIAQSRLRGWSCSFPGLKYPMGREMFVLRNEIPNHYGAQAGHSSALYQKFDLPDRFFYSILPKVIIEKDGKSYSLFREGCPYHKITEIAFPVFNNTIS
jgi:hypothetical protein